MNKEIEGRTAGAKASDQGRRQWTRPVMVRLIAGKAENATGPVADDPVNFS